MSKQHLPSFLPSLPPPPRLSALAGSLAPRSFGDRRRPVERLLCIAHFTYSLCPVHLHSSPSAAAAARAAASADAAGPSVVIAAVADLPSAGLLVRPAPVGVRPLHPRIRQPRRPRPRPSIRCWTQHTRRFAETVGRGGGKAAARDTGFSRSRPDSWLFLRPCALTTNARPIERVRAGRKERARVLAKHRTGHCPASSVVLD